MRKFLATCLLAATALWSVAIPTAAFAQIVTSQSQLILPPYGSNGFVVSTTTANGAKLSATSTPFFSRYSFVNASGTVLSLGTLCLDTCRSTWPSGSGGSDPFTHPSANVSATTSGIIISASSTVTGGLFTASNGASTTQMSATTFFGGIGSVTNPAFWVSGAGGLYKRNTNEIGLTNGVSSVGWDGTSLVPGTTDARDLGSIGNRWDEIFGSFLRVVTSGGTATTTIFNDSTSHLVVKSSTTTGDLTQLTVSAPDALGREADIVALINLPQGGTRLFEFDNQNNGRDQMNITETVTGGATSSPWIFQMCSAGSCVPGYSFDPSGAQAIGVTASSLLDKNALLQLASSTALRLLEVDGVRNDHKFTVFQDGVTINVASTTINGNATTTGNFTTLGQASSTSLRVSNLKNCDTIDTDGTGLLSCGTDASGAGGSWPFTPDSFNAIAAQSTTTNLWLKGAMIIASTTYFTNASTTGLTISGNSWFTGLTGPGPLAIDSTGKSYVAATTTFSGTAPITTSLAGNVLTIACATCYTGNGFNFTPTTWNSIVVNSTSTGLWLKGSPVSLMASTSVLTFASSTALTAGNLFSTNASTTALIVSNSANGVLVTDGTGSVSASSTLGLNRIPTCLQITGSAALCDGDDATGAGGGGTPSKWATSTVDSTSIYSALAQHVGIGTSTPWGKLAISANHYEPYNNTYFSVSSSTPTGTTTLLWLEKSPQPNFGSQTDITNLKMLNVSGATYVNEYGTLQDSAFIIAATDDHAGTAQVQLRSAGYLDVVAGGDGDGVNIGSGAGLTAGSTGGFVELFAGNGSTTAHGGDIELDAGYGSQNAVNGTGNGGDILLTGGNGGAAGGTGGDVWIASGGSAASTKGTINFSTGNNGSYATLDTTALSNTKVFSFPNWAGTFAIATSTLQVSSINSTSTATSTFRGGLSVTAGGLNIGTLTSSNCDVKSDTSGNIYCGTDATGGGGGSWPFTFGNDYAGLANTQSTTSPLRIINMLIASSTYFTQASSSMTTLGGTTWFTGLTGPGPLAIDSTGKTYVAATTTFSGTAPVTASLAGNVLTIACATCYTGTGFDFTPTLYNNVVANSTSTPIWFKATNPFSLMASSTFATQASSTQLSVADKSWFTGLATMGAASTTDLTTSNSVHFSQLAGNGLVMLDLNKKLIMAPATSSPAFYANGGTNGSVLGQTNGVVGWVATSSSGASLSGGVAGMLAGWTSATTIAPTSTPTVASIIATSSTATSTFAGAVYVGTTTSGQGANIPFFSIDTGSRTSEEAFMVAGNVNDFFENNIKNGSAGAAAQGCWTATNNGGSLTTGFVALCANSTGFWTPAAYNVGGAGDTSLMSLTTGDFYLAQSTAGKALRFMVGGNSTTTLSGNETFNMAGATTTSYRDFRIATTSGSAFNITDKYGATVLNLSTASTTSGYNLLELWSATSTGPLFAFDQYGHMSASSTVPTLSSCGTSPTITSDSSDFSGTITVGSVAATACTLTFGTPHTVATHCVISEQTGSVVNAASYTTSLTGFTYSQTGLTSDKLDYICTGK